MTDLWEGDRIWGGSVSREETRISGEGAVTNSQTPGNMHGEDPLARDSVLCLPLVPTGTRTIRTCQAIGFHGLELAGWVRQRPNRAEEGLHRCPVRQMLVYLPPSAAPPTLAAIFPFKVLPKEEWGTSEIRGFKDERCWPRNSHVLQSCVPCTTMAIFCHRSLFTSTCRFWWLGIVFFRSGVCADGFWYQHLLPESTANNISVSLVALGVRC